MAEKSEDFYTVDNPEQQSWWKDVIGDEDIPGVMRVFYEAGVEPVCDNRRNYVGPIEDAFSETDYQKIFEAAEDVYESFEQFMEKVEDSSIHPQQTYQIRKARRQEQIEKEFPVKFGPYDGMAVTESIQTDY